MTPDVLDRGRTLSVRPSGWAPARFAFPLNRRCVSMSLPMDVPGSYLLLGFDSRPMYVGRSDSCLRQRLATHPLRGKATHFTAAVTDDARGAYLLECYWFHRYRSDGQSLLNLIHPAAWRSDASCPFCPTDAGHAACPEGALR